MIKQIGLTNQPLYPTKTFVSQSPKEQPVVNNIKFGMEGSSSGGTLDGIEGGIESAITSYAMNKIIGSFKLSESEKTKLKELGMPDEFFKGMSKIKDAEKKDNIESEVREAKWLFDLAADKAKLKAFQRASNRMAAISAKLINEPLSAREFMDKSLNKMHSAAEDDKEKIRDLSSLTQTLTDGIKLGVFSPFVFIEALGQKVLNKPEDTPLTTVKLFLKATPMDTAQDDLIELTKTRNDELDAGEESDDEWIKGKDRKDLGTSTGKGMRHQIPLVEKQRLAKKDGNDLISGMSKLTLR